MDEPTSDGAKLLQAIQKVSATSAANTDPDGDFQVQVLAHIEAGRVLGEVLESTLNLDERKRLLSTLMDEFTDHLDHEQREAADRFMEPV